ncbi:biotin--[acetyl-CoA-carboxylase] ligase [Desulfonema ishimotonii]|uniref:Bifunctional ligase/repressor BirA n=1 Tax=Desulfonema ishimotonii TaxID=45657 RepID=A0A401FYY6_9BACT|nr:biotin--[acetyl-CoA-carboxylase] ligase [Desulfonema ishimotonii]GBC62175.1 biotin--[acetyl-CoA-carboxylase] ligase [Desulfonema ishimotonii]
MKSKIIRRLRDEREILSGEALSTDLGVSRVSVWKHIRQLQEMGYGIDSAPKGYRLTDTPDVLWPWEFPGREERIHYFPETGSTMTVARKMARNGCPAFTVVIAGQQTGGRGRLQRKWLSDDGGLYFTVVVRPEIPPVLSSRISFVASLSLAGVLRKQFGVNAQVKWPNDILVDEKKLTGMLSEMETDADMVSFVNIGMGINVNNDPTPDESRATSLARLLGRTVPRRAILAAFLDDFEARMAQVDYDTVIGEWKEFTLTLGRRVRIVTTSETYEGRAADVEKDGTLILELGDGTRKSVIFGDCFLQPPGE